MVDQLIPAASIAVMIRPATMAPGWLIAFKNDTPVALQSVS